MAKLKLSEKVRRISVFALFALIGASAGYFGSKYANDAVIQTKLPLYILIILKNLFFVLAFFIQIVLHELGHLIFGYISGYKFVFFRLGKWLFYKKEDKIKFKKHIPEIRGIAGQCIMTPPALKDKEEYRYPFFWYHAGGIAMNFITALIAGIIATAFKEHNPYIYLVCMAFVETGLLLSLSNAYPFSPSLPNDGRNIRLMLEYKQVRRYHYNSININAHQMNGKRLKDFDEFFLIPRNDEFYGDDVYSKSLEYMVYGDYWLDKKDYLKALELYEKAYPSFKTLPTAYTSLLFPEYLYLLIINNKNIDEIRSAYYSDFFNEALKSIKLHPKVSIAKYAFEKLIIKDDDLARKTLEIYKSFKGKRLVEISEITEDEQIMEVDKMAKETSPI